MKKIVITLAVALCSRLAMQAQVPEIFQDMQHVKVVQDSSLTQLMLDKKAGVIHGIKEMPGFRVQIFSDNTPGESKVKALQLQERFSQELDQPVYVMSSPPFFKVRIGDFQTQEEAATYKTKFVEQFPEMAGETYVVRDEHIQVRQ